MPRKGSAERPHQHDDAWRDAVGGGALQQRRLRRTRTRASARAIRATACRSGCRRGRRRAQEETRTKGILPFLDPLPRWEVRSPATCCACSNAAAAKKRRDRQSDADEDPGRPDDKLSDRGFGTRAAHRSGLPRPAEDAPARSAAVVPRHQRSARRLSRQRLHRLPRHLRQ